MPRVTEEVTGFGERLTAALLVMPEQWETEDRNAKGLKDPVVGGKTRDWRGGGETKHEPEMLGAKCSCGLH